MQGTATALCAALTIDDAGVDAPDWLHLLPAGLVRTVDGRGPFRVVDAAALMAVSISAGKLPLDVNHATDLAAPRGDEAPARGWIVELQARGDGIWGRVDWTGEGRRIMADKQYRGVSPVIAHRKDGTITAILRASLTNTPNLEGLVALHHVEKMDMDFRTMLIEALGLDRDADDAAIAAALAKMKEGGGKGDVPAALQSALAPIARIAGLPDTADAAAVLAGVEALAGGADDRMVSLQAELTQITASLQSVTDERRRDKATVFVDAAIAAGRVGVKPVRAEYIGMHMRDPAAAEKLVNAMPTLSPGATTLTVLPVEGSPENPTLLAQKAGAYQAKLARQGIAIDFASAVRSVNEGKAA